MPESKGHLNPGSPMVELSRFDVAPALANVVRHVWIARWHLPPGAVDPQRVLTSPTFNLVVTDGTAALYGPEPKVQVRALTGSGWAFGLLLRPAAGVLLSSVAPVDLVGRSCPVSDAPMREIESALGAEVDARIVDRLLSRWLCETATRVDDRGRLVNHVCRLAEEDDSILRVADLARRAQLSTRSLERLVVGHVGLPPKWLIECRRLQHAATTLYARPEDDLTELALTLGYTDYAHFSRRYKAVIGETPNQTRTLGRARQRE